MPTDFIVDIGVMYKGDDVPSGWTVLDRTVHNHDANCNKGGQLVMAKAMYIVYRRGQGPEIDPSIVEDMIILCPRKEPLPNGYTIIKETVQGKKANLNCSRLKSGASLYVTVRKSPRFGATTRGLVDIGMIRPKKGEQTPAGYTMIPRNLNEGSKGEDLYLCVRYANITSRPAVLPPVANRLSAHGFPRTRTYSTDESTRIAMQAEAQMAAMSIAAPPRVTPNRGGLQRQMSLRVEDTRLKDVPIIFNEMVKSASEHRHVEPAEHVDPMTETQVNLLYQYCFDLEKDVLRRASHDRPS